MDLFEPQLIIKKEVKFTEPFTDSSSNVDENFGDVFGGIIKSGQWGWLTKGSRLRIMSIRTGQLITKFDFDESNGFGVCIITCVSEVNLPFLVDSIIAIGLQYVDSPGGIIALYSVEESSVLKCIELKHKITCCKFISHEMSQHTVMQNMNGCLAVGTDGGNVLLVDLNLRVDELNSSTMDSEAPVVPCHIVDHNMSVLHLHRHFQHCQREGVHFGIQLEALDNAEFVQSLLPIDITLGLAVGLGDGRLVLYDLTDMLIFFVAPPQERSSPLVKMSFMEPPDDPRPCVYIWAFHENYQNSKAVLHSLMYEKRVEAEDGFSYFENFQASSVRLLLPLNTPKSVPLACQTIFKPPSHGNDETISLCALVWKHEKEKQTEVLLFDINQWYKEEMPPKGDWREEPSYLASFVLPEMNAVEFFFNSKTASLFNSIHRSEEHFYPVSLSFDCVALGETGCFHLNWPGVQNRVINFLRSKGSLALLDPNPVFIEILNTKLLPQFSKHNYKSTFSLQAKRETLLSVALEQNCIGLLKECAKNWSDGSHRGPSLQEALTLSTLTDWLWSRASSIKERCNTLCQVLFNHSGRVLDQREQKELGYISKQLKTLADLLTEIITKYEMNIPSDVLTTLQTQAKSIHLASDYQEILLWLLNIGLLPEASRPAKYREIEMNLVPYPYDSLQGFYINRRMDFTRLNEKFASRKTGSCFLLFIDSFIEHEFKRNSLRDSWQETGGDGLYPPTTIQAMLRIMLSPDVSFENKCALFLYFFLDLNMAIEDKRYESIVQNFIKFPSVFKLSASLIKQIQAFWNLDHCRFPAAVDEFISPFNKDHVCPQWQLELFIESLLAQSESNLALRVLEAKSSPISPVLQLNTYLANDLISEAFHFARSKQDEDLLRMFFTGCLCTGKFGVIRDLALTESEGALVQSILKNSKSRNAENLHFVYLLQKYKYIEAVSYLDELSKGRVVQRAVDVDTPTLVLSAYNTTMTPVTKGLSDVYFKIKNKIKSRESEQNSPYPLSCQLIKQNANDLLGGIYHSSALSTHFASQYWERHHSETNALQQSKNAPFLRRPQVQALYSELSKQNISYPDPYKAAQKRRLDQNTPEEEISNKKQDNPKKRRKMYDLSNLEAIYKPLRELSSTESLLTSTMSETRQMRSQTVPQKSPPPDTAMLLETPYFRKTSEENADSADGQAIEKPTIALQGILKGSQKSPTEEPPEQVRGVSVESDKKEKRDAEEEKSIRFVLPTIEDQSEEQMDVDDSKSEDSKDRDLPERPSTGRYSGPSKRKALRSTSSISRSKSPPRGASNEAPEQSRIVVNRTVFVDEDSGHSSINQSNASVVAESVEQEHTNVAPKKSSLEKEVKETTFTKKVELKQTKPLRVSLARPPLVRSRTPLRSASKETSPQVSSTEQIIKETIVVSSISKEPSMEKSTISESLVSRSSEPKTTESEKLVKQPPQKSASPSVTESVRIVPIVVVDAEEPEIIEVSTKKNPKRALSVSSDDQATESVQRSAKQPRGRSSIHSSSSESGENKNPTASTASEPKDSKKPLLLKNDTMFGLELKDSRKPNLLKNDTMFGFEPHMASSRVCATESRFRFVDRDSSKVVMNTEKKTSKETFSERSTIVGGLTYLPTLEASEQVTETISIAVHSGQRMMDTTVDMTMYDTMAFEHSNPPQSSESSSDGDEPDDMRDMEEEEESTNSGFNAANEYESRNNEDNDSVILLSSRSSSSTYYDDALEDSKANRSTVGHIVIDDEDDESDEVDIVERYSAVSNSNSYSNQFSEVTRTSTICSMESSSIAIDVDAENTPSNVSCREVEDGEDFEDVSRDYDFRKKEPSQEEEVMESLTVEDDSEENDGPKESLPKTDVRNEKPDETVSLDAVAEESEIMEVETTLKTDELTEKQDATASSGAATSTSEEATASSGEATASSGAATASSEEATASSVEVTASLGNGTASLGDATASSEKATTSLGGTTASTRDATASLEAAIAPSGEAIEATPEETKVETTDALPVVQKELIDGTSAKKDDVIETIAEEKQFTQAIIEEKATEVTEEMEIQSREIRSEEETTKEATGESKVSEPPVESEKSVVETKTEEEVKEKTEENPEEKTPVKEPKAGSKNVTKETSSVDTSEKKTEEKVVEKSPVKFDLNESINPSTPTTRRRRSSSFSKSITTVSDLGSDSPSTRRLSRGGSMPPSTANPAQIVTRRRSMLLEKVDETPTPDSPSTRTRSKLRVDSIDSEVDSPSVSNVKRTRLSSISSVTSMDNPTTPKGRRRSSISVDKELSNTPKTPRSIRGRSITAEDISPPIKTSRRLSTSKREKASPQSTPEDEHKESGPTRTEDFMSSRRLTRTQLATLEKSAALEKQFAQSPVRVTRRSVSRASEKESPPDVKGSDNESISSRTSHLSNASRRITRSAALKENIDDDVASIASVASSTDSGKKRKKRGKEPTSPIVLTAIPEEDASGSEKSVPISESSKKSRRQKK